MAFFAWKVLSDKLALFTSLLSQNNMITKKKKKVLKRIFTSIHDAVKRNKIKKT